MKSGPDDPVAKLLTDEELAREALMNERDSEIIKTVLEEIDKRHAQLNQEEDEKQVQEEAARKAHEEAARKKAAREDLLRKMERKWDEEKRTKALGARQKAQAERMKRREFEQAVDAIRAPVIEARARATAREVEATRIAAQQELIGEELKGRHATQRAEVDEWLAAQERQDANLAQIRLREFEQKADEKGRSRISEISAAQQASLIEEAEKRSREALMGEVDESIITMLGQKDADWHRVIAKEEARKYEEELPAQRAREKAAQQALANEAPEARQAREQDIIKKNREELRKGAREVLSARESAARTRAELEEAIARSSIQEATEQQGELMRRARLAKTHTSIDEDNERAELEQAHTARITSILDEQFRLDDQKKAETKAAQIASKKAALAEIEREIMEREDKASMTAEQIELVDAEQKTKRFEIISEEVRAELALRDLAEVERKIAQKTAQAAAEERRRAAEEAATRALEAVRFHFAKQEALRAAKARTTQDFMGTEVAGRASILAQEAQWRAAGTQNAEEISRANMAAQEAASRSRIGIARGADLARIKDDAVRRADDAARAKLKRDIEQRREAERRFIEAENLLLSDEARVRAELAWDRSRELGTMHTEEQSSKRLAELQMGKRIAAEEAQRTAAEEAQRRIDQDRERANRSPKADILSSRPGLTGSGGATPQPALVQIAEQQRQMAEAVRRAQEAEATEQRARKIEADRIKAAQLKKEEQEMQDEELARALQKKYDARRPRAAAAPLPQPSPEVVAAVAPGRAPQRPLPAVQLSAASPAPAPFGPGSVMPDQEFGIYDAMRRCRLAKRLDGAGYEITLSKECIDAILGTSPKHVNAAIEFFLTLNKELTKINIPKFPIDGTMHGEHIPKATRKSAVDVVELAVVHSISSKRVKINAKRSSPLSKEDSVTFSTDLSLLPSREH